MNHPYLHVNLSMLVLIVAVLWSTNAATTDSKYKQLILKRFARSANMPEFHQYQNPNNQNCHNRRRHMAYHQRYECKRRRFPDCVKHQHEVRKVKNNLNTALRTTIVNIISYENIDQEADRRVLLDRVFEGFDTNRDGSISSTELENYLVLFGLLAPSHIQNKDSSASGSVNS